MFADLDYKLQYKALYESDCGRRPIIYYGPGVAPDVLRRLYPDHRLIDKRDELPAGRFLGVGGDPVAQR